MAGRDGQGWCLDEHETVVRTRLDRYSRNNGMRGVNLAFKYESCCVWLGGVRLLSANHSPSVLAAFGTYTRACSYICTCLVAVTTPPELCCPRCCWTSRRPVELASQHSRVRANLCATDQAVCYCSEHWYSSCGAGRRALVRREKWRRINDRMGCCNGSARQILQQGRKMDT